MSAYRRRRVDERRSYSELHKCDKRPSFWEENISWTKNGGNSTILLFHCLFFVFISLLFEDAKTCFEGFMWDPYGPKKILLLQGTKTFINKLICRMSKIIWRCLMMRFYLMSFKQKFKSVTSKLSRIPPRTNCNLRGSIQCIDWLIDAMILHTRICDCDWQ